MEMITLMSLQLGFEISEFQTSLPILHHILIQSIRKLLNIFWKNLFKNLVQEYASRLDLIPFMNIFFCYTMTISGFEISGI